MTDKPNFNHIVAAITQDSGVVTKLIAKKDILIDELVAHVGMLTKKIEALEGSNILLVSENDFLKAIKETKISKK